MQNTAGINLAAWTVRTTGGVSQTRANVFVLVLAVSTLCSAAFASWLPLQVSVVTVFLFAGPHNWFEFRYFLTRLPARFGRSRNFFLTAFAGIGVLTLTYILLPVSFHFGGWSYDAFSTSIAGWNTLLLCWIGLLVWLRGKQKRESDWSWFPALLLAICALNWLEPMLFSVAIVYLHPLVALWFLDRHLARTRPQWLRAYRRFILLLPVVLALMIWRLSQTTPLADDNGLFWRISQHSGADLLPAVSSHLLVSVHLFLEMLHYAVWIIALPLIAPTVLRKPQGTDVRRRFWKPSSVPLASHPRGFPRLIATALVIAGLLVVVLWFAFSFDYSTTRDIYFTVAIAHVLAEAPFLLKML